MSNNSEKSKRNIIGEIPLKPRDPWFGATYEEAPIRALRDAQSIPALDKLKWLEEMNFLFNTEPQPKPGSVPLPPIANPTSK